MSKEKEANIGNPRNFSYFFTTLAVVRVYEEKKEREKNSYHCLVAAFFVNVFLKKLKKSSLKRAETTITCKTMHKMVFFHSLHSKFVRMSDFVQGRAKFAIKIESKRRKRNTEDQKNTAHTEKKNGKKLIIIWFFALFACCTIFLKITKFVFLMAKFISIDLVFCCCFLLHRFRFCLHFSPFQTLPWYLKILVSINLRSIRFRSPVHFIAPFDCIFVALSVDTWSFLTFFAFRIA